MLFGAINPLEVMEGDLTPSLERSLSFRVLDQLIRIECADPSALSLLDDNFRAWAAESGTGEADVEYCVSVGRTGPNFELSRDGQNALGCEDLGDLLFHLEHELVVELQRRRPDLLFLHAAAVDWQGNACLLAGESGSGKSLTTWGLLHHGFRYLSDELSPIDLESMLVSPYAHALNLKRPPAEPYSLPQGALHLRRTIHVPVSSMPEATVSAPRPLGAVFLLEHQPDLGAPTMRTLSRSEASARLYVNTLNALAHPSCGLEAVVRIAEQVPCFAVASAGLAATCALMSSTVERAVAKGQ